MMNRFRFYRKWIGGYWTYYPAIGWDISLTVYDKTLYLGDNPNYEYWT